MATYASRPVWDVPVRAVTRGRLAVPAALGGLVAVSLLLRVQRLSVGYWIDEGLSIGIAHRPVLQIPGVLRMDGSPPLYYLLLHYWMRIAGTSEIGTHLMSLLFALAAVPVTWWAAGVVFGDRARWFGAVLAAFNPFLTQYAQETRMYALVMLLGIPAVACFARAYALDAQDARERRRWALRFAAALAGMLYTHNWSLFFAAACAAAFAVLVGLAPDGRRRELLRAGALGFGVAAAVYLPWIPMTLYQATHTGAPWSEPPALNTLFGAPGQLLGTTGQVVLLFAAGSGLLTVWSSRARRFGPTGRALIAITIIAVLTLALPWLTSQVAPTWANRYLAIGVPPLLLLATGGLTHAGRAGLVGLAIVAVLWTGERPPSEKSNTREVAEAIAPSLVAGDLVISTQPEEIPVLAHYLPTGVKFATLTGQVHELGVWDWRNGVARLRATSPERDLAPLIDALPVGHRVVLVQPITWAIDRWEAPWTELIRIRSAQWQQFLSNDKRLLVSDIQPATFTPPRPSPVSATVLVKTAALAPPGS